MEVNYKNKKYYNTAKYPIRQPMFFVWLIWLLSKIMLLFKKKKTVYWRDVKYKKVKMGGRNKSITLYDANKKRLIAFDELIVGFERVVKLAKRSRIKILPRN